MSNFLKKTYCLLIICIAFSSCQRGDIICMTPPPPFCLRITNQFNTDLLASSYTPKDIRLYYVKNNSKVDIEFDFQQARNGTSYMQVKGLGWISADAAKSKTFYLRLSEADTDTLYVDMVEESKNNCTSFSTKQALYNGKPFGIDDSTIPTMYVLRK